MKPEAGSSRWEAQGRGCMLGAQCQLGLRAGQSGMCQEHRHFDVQVAGVAGGPGCHQLSGWHLLGLPTHLLAWRPLRLLGLWLHVAALKKHLGKLER